MNRREEGKGNRRDNKCLLWGGRAEGRVSLEGREKGNRKRREGRSQGLNSQMPKAPSRWPGRVMPGPDRKAQGAGEDPILIR